MDFTAAMFADELYEELIAQNLFEPPRIPLQPAVAQSYERRARVCRTALLLLALVTEEEREPGLLTVREAVEARVFGPQTPMSVGVLHGVRAAMKDLGSLLGPQDQPRECSWANEWLSAIGLSITNPVTLALFAQYWMGVSVAITDSLREMVTSCDLSEAQEESGKRRGEIDAAHRLVSTANIVAISALVPLIDRLPVMRTMMIARSGDDWDFFATVAGVGIGMSASEAPVHDNALERALNEWNPQGYRAYRDFAEFVSRQLRHGISLETAAGAWLLWNLMGPNPTNEQLSIAPVLGGCLGHSGRRGS